jgi:hypothetical protein
LSQKILDKYDELYETRKAGIEQSLNSFLKLRYYLLESLKGVFTKEEWVSLIDNQNGVRYESRMAGKTILMHSLEDGEAYESICTRHGSVLKDLLEKIDLLSDAQCMLLMEECNRFWYVHPTELKNLNSFIDPYL